MEPLWCCVHTSHPSRIWTGPVRGRSAGLFACQWSSVSCGRAECCCRGRSRASSRVDVLSLFSGTCQGAVSRVAGFPPEEPPGNQHSVHTSTVLAAWFRWSPQAWSRSHTGFTCISLKTDSVVAVSLCSEGMSVRMVLLLSHWVTCLFLVGWKESRVRAACGPEQTPGPGWGVLQGLHGWEERAWAPGSFLVAVTGLVGRAPTDRGRAGVQLAGGFGVRRSCLGRRALQRGACHQSIPALDSPNGVASGVL